MIQWIEEFLFRGRAPDDDQPPAYHVVIGQQATDPFDASKKTTRLLGPLTPQAAEALGFPASTLVAGLNDAALAQIDTLAARANTLGAQVDAAGAAIDVANQRAAEAEASLATDRLAHTAAIAELDAQAAELRSAATSAAGQVALLQQQLLSANAQIAQLQAEAVGRT